MNKVSVRWCREC